MNIEDSLNIAKELFPNEEWLQITSSIYVAKSRFCVNKQEKEKLDKELEQAYIFEKFEHCSVLVPEIGEGKHFDSICDGIKTEFKTVSGGIDKVGKHFDDAIQKAENVFLRIKSDFSKNKIYNAIKGHLKNKPRNFGLVYVFLDSENKMFCWNIKDISDAINEN